MSRMPWDLRFLAMKEFITNMQALCKSQGVTFVKGIKERMMDDKSIFLKVKVISRI